MKDKIAKILKEYTKKNHIMASHVILEDYAEELVKHGGIIADKSQIVELPCKVGGKVYKLTRNKVKECEVVFVGISADEKCSHFNFVENYEDGTFYKSYSMVFDVIGKTVFLTREEAEEALRKAVQK